MGAIFCTFRHDSMHAWNWVHYIKDDNKGARLSTPIFVSFCQSAVRAHVYINAVRMACLHLDAHKRQHFTPRPTLTLRICASTRWSVDLRKYLAI